MHNSPINSIEETSMPPPITKSNDSLPVDVIFPFLIDVRTPLMSTESSFFSLTKLDMMMSGKCKKCVLVYQRNRGKTNTHTLTLSDSKSSGKLATKLVHQMRKISFSWLNFELFGFMLQFWATIQLTFNHNDLTKSGFTSLKSGTQLKVGILLRWLELCSIKLCNKLAEIS